MVTETAKPERAAELRRIVGDVSVVARDLRKASEANRSTDTIDRILIL